MQLSATEGAWASAFTYPFSINSSVRTSSISIMSKARFLDERADVNSLYCSNSLPSSIKLSLISGFSVKNFLVTASHDSFSPLRTATVTVVLLFSDTIRELSPSQPLNIPTAAASRIMPTLFKFGHLPLHRKHYIIFKLPIQYKKLFWIPIFLWIFTNSKYFCPDTYFCTLSAKVPFPFWRYG